MRSISVFFLSFLFACNSNKQEVAVKPPLAKDTVATAVSDTFAFSESSAPFAGDANAIAESLFKMRDFFLSRQAALPKDTFPLNGRSADGGEMLVTIDKMSGVKKYFGAEFGETGRFEFEFYLNKQHELLLAHFTTYRYDKHIMEGDVKEKVTEEKFQLFHGNSLFAIANEKKAINSVSAADLKKNEGETKQLFKEYMQHIKAGGRYTGS